MRYRRSYRRPHKSRFVEMFGNVEAGTAKFPIVNLADVCQSISAGKDVPEDSVKISDENHKVPIYSNGIENDGLYGFANEARITKPSITISGRGTIGFVKRREQPFVPIIRLIVATPNREIMDLSYLEAALSGRCAKNTGTSIPQLTVPVARRIKVMTPPLALQREFAAFVAKVDKLAFAARQRRDVAKQLYRAKIQEFFG